MSLVAKIVFWFSLSGVFYAFCGYLMLLWAISRLKSTPAPRPPATPPRLSLVISAYNEAAVIKTKLDNAVELAYPAGLLEIIVISDASDDGTDEIVQQFGDRQVRLLRQATRAGKTAALNLAVPQTRGEIIVFSDANSMYDQQALLNLARHFADPAIGFVSGRTKYVSTHSRMMAETTSLYTRLEIATKGLESSIASCVGADGAIFAIRKELFVPLQAYDINDFVIPLSIIQQGYRGILDRDAFCCEETAKDAEGEFNRQVRITCRTIRAIFNHKALLNPIKYPVFSFELISHKIMKFMLPLFMVAAFFSNLILINGGLEYRLLFSMQFCYYALCAYGYVTTKNKEKNRLIGIACTFGMVAMAFFFGWIKYFSGETYATWGSERP